MIVIAFDFGIKNIGVAIGENITKKGRPLNSLKSKNGCPNWIVVKKLLQTWQPKFAIVGLPLNMNGTKQEITKKAEKFANLLKCKFNAFVKLHDERLSTIEAKSLMFNHEKLRTIKSKTIHSFAAVIILESWFLEYNSKN
ncbi:Holliday junction resolvase RuvX [Buchnera aphidicola (Muscaphis stroyani)]|uniref:Putative pre-16S rRNA nuclease n=1 Tax=Buchnera aphidicola (Muscaphis stroyani) TaxID=1241869 RepID=A0A4D6YD84_9GAMM|nr:Holliday junction resolvase RuvX [Buchnera aphidicola]QCI24581.1 Holliday junction resolvase RuvX [Buchnera aphidicola (Muscaphis stroyani)]